VIQDKVSVFNSWQWNIDFFSNKSSSSLVPTLATGYRIIFLETNAAGVESCDIAFSNGKTFPNVKEKRWFYTKKQ